MSDLHSRQSGDVSRKGDMPSPKGPKKGDVVGSHPKDTTGQQEGDVPATRSASLKGVPIIGSPVPEKKPYFTSIDHPVPDVNEGFQSKKKDKKKGK